MNAHSDRNSMNVELHPMVMGKKSFSLSICLSTLLSLFSSINMHTHLLPYNHYHTYLSLHKFMHTLLLTEDAVFSIRSPPTGECLGSKAKVHAWWHSGQHSIYPVIQHKGETGLWAGDPAVGRAEQLHFIFCSLRHKSGSSKSVWWHACTHKLGLCSHLKEYKGNYPCKKDQVIN